MQRDRNLRRGWRIAFIITVYKESIRGEEIGANMQTTDNQYMSILVKLYDSFFISRFAERTKEKVVKE